MMTQPRLPTATGSDNGITRRTFLAGLETLGFVGFGTKSPRETTASESDTDGSRQEKDLFTDSDDLEAFVDDVMADRIGTTTPGATVAIVKGDTPILTKGYGSADVASGVPVQADETVFRVGSVGKLVTFTAVMQCVERGVLDLDADVNSYLNDSVVTVPERYDEPVTLEHLGTHTAGFESALDPDIVADPTAVDSLESVLAGQQRPRVRPPGELVGYSNYGAALAGHVVAAANDTTFEEYVRSEVFDPLGMSQSTFVQPVPDDHPGGLAAPHIRDADSFTRADDVYINMRPAGSLSATATDMAAFMSAHLGAGSVGKTRIIDAATADMMHSRHHIRHPAVTNWRYGFHEYGDPEANLIAHSGATINFSSHLLLAPDRDIGIFVAYNSNPSEPPAAAVDEIVAESDLQPAPTSPTPTSKPGGRERAKTAAGEYGLTYLPESGPLQVVDLLEHVTVEPAGDGRLRTATLDGDTRTWIETDPYVYQEVGGHDVLAFEVAHGDVEVMNMSSEPTGVYQPVPFHERRLVAGGILGVTLSGFGLSLAGWGGLGAWRQWKQRQTEREPESGASE